MYLIGLLATCGGLWAFDDWRLRADWHQAQRDVAAGKPGAARVVLARLAARWPLDGEVQYRRSARASWRWDTLTVLRRHGRACARLAAARRGPP